MKSSILLTTAAFLLALSGVALLFGPAEIASAIVLGSQRVADLKSFAVALKWRPFGKFILIERDTR